MKKIGLVWLISLAAKIALGAWLPFAADEAYYWVWGQHPQLSYYDHPGMIGWLFWLGEALFPHGTLSRLPGILLGHATILIWLYILRPLLSAEHLFFWLLLVSFSPFLGPGSIIMTPDLPLLFFWSLSLLLLLKALQKNTAYLWAGLGLSLGLGFCSKYHIVLFVPTALLWLFTSGRWRELRVRNILLTVVFGLIACAPVLWWNFSTDFISFRFQLAHGLAGERFQWAWPLTYLLSQYLILSPPLAHFAWRHPRQKEFQFLYAFAWFPLVFFLLTSFRARVEANWTMAAYPALLTLAFIHLPNMRWVKVMCSIWALALLVLISDLMHPWLPVNRKRLKTYEYVKFNEVIEVARQHEPVFLGSYQMAAQASFKLQKPMYKLRGLNRVDMNDFWPGSEPTTDVFYAIIDIEQNIPQWVFDKGYRVVRQSPIDSEFRLFEVTRRAKTSH